MATNHHWEVELVRGDKSEGWNTLVVGEDTLRWGDSLALEYSAVVLHAVCTDPDTYPRPCIYCQVEDGEEGDMEELRFVPKDASQVQNVFSEMSRCAALHPDEAEEDGDEFDNGEMFDASTAEEKLQMFERAFVEPNGPPPSIVPGQFDEVDETD